MSELQEHFEKIGAECKVVCNEGHFAEKEIARATTDILLIVGKVKDMIQKEQEKTQ